jgi:hypothetical protein
MLQSTVSRPVCLGTNHSSVGLRPDLYYCQTVPGLLMWGALSDERTGLSFIIAAGPRQRSHFWVRVPQNSWPYFTVSDSRLPQPGGPGPRIYNPPGTGLLFRRLLRLAGLRWGYSNPPPHGLRMYAAESTLWDPQITHTHTPLRNCTCHDRVLSLSERRRGLFELWNVLTTLQANLRLHNLQSSLFAISELHWGTELVLRILDPLLSCDSKPQPFLCNGTVNTFPLLGSRFLIMQQ